MNCAEVEARLVDGADGRLDAPTEVRLYAHIDGCGECRARAALWRRLVPGMRALAPPAPDAMQARRMQLEVERRLAGAVTDAPGRDRRWRPRVWAAAGFAVAAAAAAALLVAAPRMGGARRGPAVAAAPYAVAVRVAGDVRAGGRSIGGDAHLDAGAELTLAAAAEADLMIGRASAVRVQGAAQLALNGDARAIVLRLDRGTIEATVGHRQADEAFAVVTADARVEVRGTRFAVGAEARGSWVRVSEGRVEVRFSDGRVAMVSAGETVSSAGLGAAPAARAPETGAGAPPTEAAPETGDSAPVAAAACAEARRTCRIATRAARGSMRAGAYARALGLVNAAAAGRDGPAACAQGAGDCADELGYLRAEALRLLGRLDAAIAAYRDLDRRGAPAMMRQNALYAAAQLEARQGRAQAALADYERALAAAPGGALREEALQGAMESAAASGERERAAVLARRYLDEFPDGLGAAAARRLAAGGAHR